MDIFTQVDLKTLSGAVQGPCVSLFMPAHRGGSEQDPIRWKNLLRRAEELLTARGMRATAVQELLRPATHLVDDVAFWKGQSDGLAFFLAPGLARRYRVPLPLAELVVVGERFHLKPLLPLLARDGRFYVLAISQNRVRLLQGSAHAVDEVDLKGVPANLAEALRFHDRDEPLRFHGRPTSSGGWGAIFSGQGVGIDDHKDDLLRYFQQIDRGLHELLREAKAPLVLASVEYLWPIYRQANTYPHLLDQGVGGNPDRLSAQELHGRAWAVVGPAFQKARDSAAAQYDQLSGTGRTANDLAEVVGAAVQGKVETLFVARDVERWGTFDAAAGSLVIHDRQQVGDEDLLNLAALHTLQHRGTVYAVDGREVPGHTPVAAIFWLPMARKEM
jgi:hypothetical protein